MYFGIGLVVVLFGWLLYKWGATFEKPQLLYSDLSDLETVNQLVYLPRYLLFGALLFFGVAFLNPHYSKKAVAQRASPTEGLAIYLVLDQSSSMGQGNKMSLLKEVTVDFVKKRSQDLVGLVSFARGAQVLAPLTLDHEEIMRQLNQLKIIQDKDQDGTAIGYAIYKTANLIDVTRHFTGAQNKGVIILVTDGFQSPSPLDAGRRLRNIDLSESGEFAKSKNIKLYIISVEPRMNEERFAPQRRLMERVAEATGGKFYSGQLSEIYASIDQIEKSEIITPKAHEEKVSFYAPLIAIGIACLLLSIILEGTFFRRFP